jgi:hypothetical protein
MLLNVPPSFLDDCHNSQFSEMLTQILPEKEFVPELTTYLAHDRSSHVVPQFPFPRIGMT